MSTHRVDLVGTPNIETTRWRIDPARSSVEFRAKVWGLPAVKGRFSRYRGTLDLSGQPAIELTIETESLDTKHKKRDAHLRSPDFFGAEQHPYVRFVSESATVDGDRLKVRGRLHARGSSLPLELDVMLRRVGDELEVEAATHADHQHLGMTWNKLGMLRTPSQLTLKGRLVQDGA
jgi:polyisoprenoid-binding protein YceI